MARGKRNSESMSAIAIRLAGVKAMVAGTADALPSTARDLRRNACETLDDIILELRGK